VGPVPAVTGQRLCIVGCASHARELRAVLDAEDAEDVSLVLFPTQCERPRMTWEWIQERATPQLAAGDAVLLLGAGCTFQLGEPPAACAGIRVLRPAAQCQHWYAAPEMLDDRVRRGAHVVTPGWLARWQVALRDMGLDQPTARALYGETTQVVLLLDTGAWPDSHQKLVAFAEFIGRPHETLKVGVGRLRNTVMRAVLEWRLERARSAADRSRREAADRSMSLDILGGLAEARSEATAVAGLTDLFGALFAPGRVWFLAHGVDVPPGPTSSGGEDSDASPELLAALREPSSGTWWDADRGWLGVSLSRGPDRIGVFVLEALACPEFAESYVGVLEELTGLCGLALGNARAYEALDDARRSSERQAADLARSNAELDQFASTVSHDLREPLRMVTMYTELVASRYAAVLDERGLKYMNYAVDGAQRMRRLITDLLALSRVGTRANTMRAVDSGQLVASVVRSLGPAIKEAGASVAVGALPVVYADPTQLAQVFQNLIANAVKFRAEAPPRVQVEAARRGDKWAFSVRDNGIGIPVGSRERIFGVFQRLHGRDEFEGTGIGLAVVKRVLDRHGSVVQVDDGPGGGTRFRFELLAAALEPPGGV
jgi:signal transduction histidine kinase